MELRGQDKKMGMPLPSSFTYNNQLNNRDSSSTKLHPQPINSSVDSQILNPRPSSQTLVDHYPLSHHLELNQQHQAVNIDQVVGATAGNNRSSSSGLKSPAATSHPAEPVSSSSPPLNIRYRECLKNHAATMGAHVVDGCGEFMPSTGEDGTMEALKCAACECHRNFHRKEINGESQYYAAPQPSSYHHHHHPTSKNGVVHLQQPAPLNQQRFPLGLSVSTPSTAGPIAPVMMNFGGGGGGGGAAAESSSEDLNMFQSNPGGGQSSRKRFRTKFSKDQKDKMMEFAEKLGWRIQKQDEQELQQFCGQVGVKRQVFKVWMHNNKQAMKRKQMPTMRNLLSSL